MDNKTLIIFVACVVGFLALPVVVKTIKGEPLSPSSATSAPATAPAPAAAPELQQFPLLNESNLIGSEWEISTEQYVLKCTLQASGAMYITHPMLKTMTGRDFLEGRWRVAGNKLYVTGNISGKEYSEELTIAGMDLYKVDTGGKASKVSRFR